MTYEMAAMVLLAAAVLMLALGCQRAGQPEPAYAGGSCLKHAKALLAWERANAKSIPDSKPRPADDEIWCWGHNLYDHEWKRSRKDKGEYFPQGYLNAHFTLTAGVWLEDGLRYRAMGLTVRVPAGVQLSSEDEDCPGAERAG